MSKTPDQISAQVLATLATTMPTLSCAIGTPERKIIDAVSGAISEAYIDQYLLGGMLDIDTKSGAELDQFVGIFGFGRLQGTAAIGVVTITATIASTSDTSFASATQYYTTPGLAGIATQLYYSATQTVVMTAGNTTCQVPVQCTTVGSAGNVPPGSITFAAGSLGGSTCTNLAAMTGGTDTETDAELRQRFKDTFLRNVSGTSDWYEALCQQNTNVDRVVVFGPISLYQTQIAVPSSELVLSVTQNVKYAWPQMESVFTGLSTTAQTFYSPIDDYIYEGGTSPTITTVTTGALASQVGQIVDLEFQYTTQSSRNDPLNGITNKVDVFVDGVNPFAITEQSVVSSATLNGTNPPPTGEFYTGNFERVGSPGVPTAGNRFQRLGSTPLVSFPSTLTIGGVVYSQGTHYFLLQDTTLLAGTQLETSGLEWTSGGPATGTEVTLNYVYNQVPEILNALVCSSKQITTDVLVHQADYIYVQPCLQIEYSSNYSPATVNTSITNRLQQYFSQLPFGAWVYMSNICMFVQQTLGVVNVTVTTEVQNSTNFGIQVFDAGTDTVPSTVETTDFQLNDNQLANFQGVLITRVATP
jgi:uncharacterized phage protein gp47/JayE